MVTHLYRDFLFVPEQYAASEAYWSALVEDLASRRGQSGQWKSWMLRKYADGTPMPPDGNPIFDAVSARLSRAVRIIQYPPFRNEIELSAWLDHFDYSLSGGPGPTDELTIGCALSEESGKIARALIDLWMDEATTPSLMSSAITETIADLPE